MNIQALPYIILLSLVFGSTMIASRVGVGQFNPVTYISLRLLLASLGYVLLYVLRIVKRNFPRDPHLWLHSAILGVIGTAIPMTSIVSFLQFQSSGVTSVLIATGPAVTGLMAHYFLPDERLSFRKGMGVVLAFGGALLLVIRGESGLPDADQFNPIGYVLVFLSILASSTMVIYARKFMSQLDHFDVAGIRIFFAAITIIPVMILFFGYDFTKVNIHGWIVLGYATVIGTFFGFLLQFYNIKRFGVTAAVMVAYLIPIVASIGGYLLLDEVITLGMLTGMTLILIGVWLINKK